jgi:hypothetical protein
MISNRLVELLLRREVGVISVGYAFHVNRIFALVQLGLARREEMEDMLWYRIVFHYKTTFRDIIAYKSASQFQTSTR